HRRLPRSRQPDVPARRRPERSAWPARRIGEGHASREDARGRRRRAAGRTGADQAGQEAAGPGQAGQTAAKSDDDAEDESGGGSGAAGLAAALLAGLHGVHMPRRGSSPVRFTGFMAATAAFLVSAVVWLAAQTPQLFQFVVSATDAS